MSRTVTRLTWIASLFLLAGCALWRDEAPVAAAPVQTAAAAPPVAAPPPPPMVIGRAAPHFASDPADFVCHDGASLRVTGGETPGVVRVSLNGGAPVSLQRADEDGLIAYRANGLVLRRAGPRAAFASEAATVTVREGDTLGLIARRIYGDRLRASEIAAANADTVANPNLIYPGQVLRLPASERRCRRTSSERWALTPVADRGG